MQEADVEILDDLVERAAARDADAFRELFLRYHDRLYRYAYLRVGKPEEARDVLQDVFLAVWRGLPGFRREHEASFPAWLFGIAAHVVGTHHRKARRRAEVQLGSVPDREIEFEGHTVNRRMLVQALGRLPEMQREVVVLRFMVGLTGREVAGAIGKSQGAVEALQLRALRQLRRHIGGER